MRDGIETLRRVMPYAKVAQYYRDLISGRLEPRGDTLQESVENWKSANRGSGYNYDFYGAGSDEMLGRLNSGYDFPPGNLPDMPVDLTGTGPRWTFNDSEGDYLHEEFMSGESDYYVERQIAESKPGIYLHVECSFVCDTPHETVSQYGQWVGATVAAIQGSGYDVALRLTSTLDSLYEEEAGKRAEIVVQVTRFGEVLLPRDFAVLFSPGGYRHLIFLAKMIPGEEIIAPAGTDKRSAELVTPSGGLGTPIMSHGWGVEFDADARILHFTPDSHGSPFPEEFMSATLREVQEQF